MPRLGINFVFGPGPTVALSADLELRATYALTRHISLSAGLVASFIAVTQYGPDFGFFGTGGFLWVL